MGTTTLIILSVVSVGVLSGGIGFFLRAMISSRSEKASSNAASQQLKMAQERSKELLIEAKDDSLQIKLEAQKEINEEKRKIQEQQIKVDSLNLGVQKQISEIDNEQSKLLKEKGLLEQKKEDISIAKKNYTEQIEKISGISFKDAKNILLDEAQEDIEYEIAKKYRNAEKELEINIEEKAKNVIAEAIQKYASDVVSEETIQSVTLPNEEMKGRLIGRDGRNIRSLENATGVDLIIDEIPETVTVSCFDPVRRHIAVKSLEALILDGRIHPARIEAIVNKTQKEVEKTIIQAGEDATFQTGIKGLHPELIKMIGRLKYRYSYGENVLQHSIEVAHLAGSIASEIGADEKVSKTGGFLHDIGKSLTHELEGPHAEIGADLVAKYHKNQEVITTIREHHDSEFSLVESFIVASADAISASRPGARKDSAEAYIKRLKDIEEIAMSFEGVEKCFAIQAGRELRVMVDPLVLDDNESTLLARNIVNKIQELMNYPGQIKVVVIRESRAIEIA